MEIAKIAIHYHHMSPHRQIDRPFVPIRLAVQFSAFGTRVETVILDAVVVVSVASWPGGPGCPLWGYRGGIATRSCQLSRKKSELKHAQSMDRMDSTSSDYATQVA